jgi:hypothetical protein
VNAPVLSQLAITFLGYNVQFAITFVHVAHKRAQVYECAYSAGYNVRTLSHNVQSFERYTQGGCAHSSQISDGCAHLSTECWPGLVPECWPALCRSLSSWVQVLMHFMASVRCLRSNIHHHNTDHTQQSTSISLLRSKLSRM